MTTEEIDKATQLYQNKLYYKDVYADMHFKEGAEFVNKHFRSMKH